MTEHLHDLAHIGHAELLTPFADESLRFFVELFGMEIEHRDGGSVYLRGWGDYQRYSLKLTEAELPGLGHMAIRAWSQEALERRVGEIERSGLGIGWIDGDHGHGPAYQFTDPDGHAMELYYETERYEPPRNCDRRSRTFRSATSGAARPSSALTTSTCSPPTSARTAGSHPSSSAFAFTNRSSTTTAPRSALG